MQSNMSPRWQDIRRWTDSRLEGLTRDVSIRISSMLGPVGKAIHSKRTRFIR